MSESIKAVIFLLSYVVCLVFLIQVWRQIRSLRLKNIASKYKLNYKKNYIFSYPNYDYDKFNLISGIINSKTVEIYDYVSRMRLEYHPLDPDMPTNGIDNYGTILQINGEQIKSKKKHFAKISYIEDELKKLAV